MKFKNDAKYFVRFSRVTEKIIRDMTSAEFIKYLKEKALIKYESFISIDDKQFKCIVYRIRDEQSLNLRNFIVVNDNRVFYHKPLNENYELVDSKKDEKAINEKYKLEYEGLKYDILIGLYNKSRMAFAIQYGRLLAFLELSDFTPIERDNEEDKLHELYLDWDRRYNEVIYNEKI